MEIETVAGVLTSEILQVACGLHVDEMDGNVRIVGIVNIDEEASQPEVNGPFFGEDRSPLQRGITG